MARPKNRDTRTGPSPGQKEAEFYLQILEDIEGEAFGSGTLGALLKIVRGQMGDSGNGYKSEDESSITGITVPREIGANTAWADEPSPGDRFPDETPWALFFYTVAKEWHFLRGAAFRLPVPRDYPEQPLVQWSALKHAMAQTWDPLDVFFAEARRQINDHNRHREQVSTAHHGWGELDDDPESDSGPGMATTPATKTPATLQEQVDHEWHLTAPQQASAALGPWEVPVPAWIDGKKHIFSDTEAIPVYFSGLELFHNPVTNTIRPILPLEKRKEPPAFARPTRLICQFLRANEELWKWVGQIKREKKMISLAQWSMVLAKWCDPGRHRTKYLTL